MSLSVYTPCLSEIGKHETRTSPVSWPCPRLARACMAVWPNATAMSHDLAELGNLHVVPRTCQNWRTGKTEPIDSQGQIVRNVINKIARQKIIAMEQIIKATAGGVAREDHSET